MRSPPSFWPCALARFGGAICFVVSPSRSKIAFQVVWDPNDVDPLTVIDHETGAVEPVRVHLRRDERVGEAGVWIQPAVAETEPVRVTRGVFAIWSPA